MKNEHQQDLALAREGSREALDRILARTQGRLRRLASSRLGDGLRTRVQTSDLLQSTYLDVVRGVRDFEGETEDAFVAWVARVLENNIRDKGKYFGARKRQEPDVQGQELRPNLKAVPTPSTEVTKGEDLLRVSRALEALQGDYRRIILLRLVEGRSHKEAAAMLGRSEAATRMLLSRARAALALEIDRLLEST